MGKLGDWFETKVVPWYTALGLSKQTVTLEVMGRTTGKTRRVTVGTVADRGSRYLVSVHGESQWVRNVRAADGNVAILSGRRMPVRLTEIPIQKREYILMRYIQQGSFGQTSAQIARAFGLEPDASLDQVNAIADEHPVFRIEELSEDPAWVEVDRRSGTERRSGENRRTLEQEREEAERRDGRERRAGEDRRE